MCGSGISLKWDRCKGVIVTYSIIWTLDLEWTLRELLKWEETFMRFPPNLSSCNSVIQMWSRVRGFCVVGFLGNQAIDHFPPPAPQPSALHITIGDMHSPPHHWCIYCDHWDKSPSLHFFFKVTLFRYNLHIMQFIHSKYYDSMVFNIQLLIFKIVVLYI